LSAAEDLFDSVSDMITTFKQCVSIVDSSVSAIAITDMNNSTSIRFNQNFRLLNTITCPPPKPPAAPEDFLEKALDYVGDGIEDVGEKLADVTGLTVIWDAGKVAANILEHH